MKGWLRKFVFLAYTYEESSEKLSSKKNWLDEPFSFQGNKTVRFLEISNVLRGVYSLFDTKKSTSFIKPS